MMAIREYIDPEGRSPYARWFDRPDARAAAKTTTALVILLGGGTKQRQQQDIETARVRWRDYKRRKRREA